MRSKDTIGHTVVACALLAGVLLFIWSIRLSGTVPAEYRSASPGFGWAWDFDRAKGMGEADRFGEAPWPWPATVSGNRLLLPLHQPLAADGLKMTYQGMLGADRFRLDVAIEGLDPGVTYPQVFDVREAMNGLMIDDRRFVVETITPRYLRLRRIAQP